MACNNIVFSYPTIDRMAEQAKTTHDSLARLLEVAWEADVITTDQHLEALTRSGKRAGGITALAEALNESPQSVNNWYSRGVSKQACIRAQEVFGVSVTWLQEGKGSKYVNDRGGVDGQATSAVVIVEEDTGDTVRIEQFDTGGAMGHGLVLQDQPGVIRSWTVSPDWIQKNVHRITSPKNLAIVTGFGDSMKGVFNPGDPLLVDTGVTQADIDGIYFFRVGDAGFVKRLQRIPTLDGVVLRAKSANKDYDPFDIVKGMDFEIFGRVVKAWESEDF